ncbi:hypothetical protein FNF29_00980 [Cafeteria roenbergensis]|uniref:Solanesyl diphosphate synthase n=1 Tax=Cafeteria roenbergensis TaxID=33653 RepID=A0A5A8CYL3_CAFRO|nr:hypothetical protein FNF29_00980 [Cafeteria roenbergensis]|eukprot:KAA0156871.1 hypothetical protein FNF29_00980 [Cafeteria roenbergensis]
MPSRGASAHGSAVFINDSIVEHDPVPISSSDVPLDLDASAVDLSAHPGAAGVDPFALVGPDIDAMSASIRQLLGVDHPVLRNVAAYFFEQGGGKKFRPTMVLLVSRATAPLMAEAQTPYVAEAGAHGPAVDAAPAYRRAAFLPGRGAEDVAASQLRLAEITELIHTASLLHDDVIDEADTRRGVASVNSVFGNKLAVLAGDFLLARASICLARLRDVPVVECMSTIIEHLVRGEVQQMRSESKGEGVDVAFEAYMTKSFYKTASLVANSCRSAAMLAGHSDEVVDAAYRYGKHTGLAFQLVDDALDFSGSAESLGKPAMNDVAQGLTTAPVLFAARTYPELQPLMERKFRVPGDVETVAHAVKESGGLDKTHALAVAHAQMALDALAAFPPSEHRDALAALAARVVTRSS